MAGSNDFLVWAGGSNSNTLTQVQYNALVSRTSGVVTGVASAQQANKSWRQGSIMSAMLGQFIADTLNQAVVDDGTTSTIESQFIQAIHAITGLGPTGVVPGPYGPLINLIVGADGRITQASSTALGTTPVTPGQYVAPTLTVQSDGRITQIVSGNYGAIGSANIWTQTNTFPALTVNGTVTAGQVSATNLAATGSVTGSSITTTNGTIGTLSSTNISTTNETVSGTLTVGTVNATTLNATGSATAGAIHGSTLVQADNGDVRSQSGHLYAALGALGSGNPNYGTILSDFLSAATPLDNQGLQSLQTSPSGWFKLPNGFIFQWIVGLVGVAPAGSPTPIQTSRVLLPFAFPNSGLIAMISQVRNTPQGFVGVGTYFVGTDLPAVYVVTNSTTAPAGFGTAFLGVVVWALGN